MKLAVGGDHAGFSLKTKILPLLKAKGHEIDDLGSFDENPVDFPDIAAKVCEKILSGQA